jgi:CRISPR-associated protein Cas2
MRLFVFFDLPIETAAERKSYRLFRRFLIKDGYQMMQKSVYTKMVTDGQAAESAAARLRKNKPKYGLVQLLKVNESQYAGIEDVVGEGLQSSVVDSMERLVIL